MKVSQGLQIIMLTRMDNLGALLCEGASVMYQASGGHKVDLLQRYGVSGGAQTRPEVTSERLMLDLIRSIG